MTKKEFRSLEGKFIQLFSKQMSVKAGAPHSSGLDELQQYPSLSLWLHVVGVSQEGRRALEARVATVEQLKDKSDSELHRILLASPMVNQQRAEDHRRLSRATHGLRKHLEILQMQLDEVATKQEADRMELFWDSWNRPGCPQPPPPPPPQTSSSFVSNPPSSASSLECSASSSSSSPKPDTAGLAYVYGQPQQSSGPNLSASAAAPHPPKPDSVASSLSSNSSLASSLPPASPGFTLSPPSVAWPERKSSPPATPPWSAAIFGQKQQKFPTTPPPAKKNSTKAANAAASNKAAAAAAAAAAAVPSSNSSDYPLTKSKSHECELGNRINPPQASASSQVDSGSSRGTITSVSGSMSLGGGVSVTAAVGKVVAERGGFGPYDGSGPSGVRQRRPRQAALSESSAHIDDAPPSGSTTAANSTPSPLPSPSPFESSLDSSASSYGASQSLQLPPKSPRTPRSMGHAIRHRFKKTLKPGRCDHCSGNMLTGKFACIMSQHCLKGLFA